MSSKVLQEKLVRLQQEKKAVLKQIEDIKDEKAKKHRSAIGLYTIEPDSDVNFEMRDLKLKAYSLKDQIEKISLQLLKRGEMTELARSIVAKKREVAAREATYKKAARKAQRRAAI